MRRRGFDLLRGTMLGATFTGLRAFACTIAIGGLGCASASADLKPLGSVSTQCPASMVPVEFGVNNPPPVTLFRLTANGVGGKSKEAGSFAAGEIKWGKLVGDPFIGIDSCEPAGTVLTELFEIPVTPITFAGRTGSTAGVKHKMIYRAAKRAVYEALLATSGKLSIDTVLSFERGLPRGGSPVSIGVMNVGEIGEIGITNGAAVSAGYSLTVRERLLKMVFVGPAMKPLRPGRVARATVTTNDPSTITARITNAAGVVVNSFQISNGSAQWGTFSWNGLGTNGLPVPDGLHTVGLTAVNEVGGQASVSAPLMVDGTSPVITPNVTKSFERRQVMTFLATDPGSGLRRTKLYIDGRQVGGSLHFGEPSERIKYRIGKLRRGVHKWRVVAIDQVKQVTRLEGTFKVKLRRPKRR